MKRIILLLVSLVFPITALAQEFPSFPMAFWGNVTLNSSPLVSGSSVAVYCGDSLVGQVMLLEDGVYGYEDAIKQKLLVSNCAGKMIFKYILRGTDVPLVGSEELSYSGFVEGAVVQKDMSFVSNRIAPDGETGNVNINNQTPLVVVSDVQLPVNAVIASGTSNPGVDVSSLVDNGVAVLPEINIVSNNASNVNVNIPANTTVNSTGNWDGVIAAPTNTTVTIPGGVPYTAIQIGFSGGKLSFNKAVRILIPGGAGKKVGYIRSGISFTEILTNCVADTQLAGDSLPGDGDCKISVGNDMVLWTKHFTTFATYALTPLSGSVISGVAKYYDGVKVVPGATVILENGSGEEIDRATTDANGFYQFTGIANAYDYAVRMEKTDNTKGVSSADQIKIGRHIVGVEPFSSIYKVIAGDVNRSGSLTAADQIKIGRLIVGLDSVLPSGNWMFYPSDADLNTSNYVAYSLKRVYNDLTQDKINQDFVAIKMGDVNNSWTNN